MSEEYPIETQRNELLADCNPYPVDDLFLKSIEEGDTLLTDDLFFKLIKESPAWLATKPILKRIAEWQYMLNNPLFDSQESAKAKYNLNKISPALAYEGQRKQEKVDNTVIYLKYRTLHNGISSFLKASNITPATSRLSAFLKAYPQYTDCFNLRGQRRYGTPEEIAIQILIKREGWSERTIRASISKNFSTI